MTFKSEVDGFTRHADRMTEKAKAAGFTGAYRIVSDKFGKRTHYYLQKQAVGTYDLHPWVWAGVSDNSDRSVLEAMLARIQRSQANEISG